MDPLVSSTTGSFSKEDIILSSSDEEDELQWRPRLLLEADLMDEEFVRRIKITNKHSLQQMGPAPLSLVRVKEESSSPPCYRVKR